MLVATLAIYAVAVAIMVALDRYGFVWKSLVIPGLVLAALLSHRLTRFVNDWAVLLAAVVLFDFVRGLIFGLVSHYELHMYVGYAIDWERWLCGGAIAPLVMQRWRASLADPDALDRFFILVHASHFVVFLFFGFLLWHARHAAFRQYALSMTALMYLGLLLYLLVPTVPPWMAANVFGALPAVEHITARVYNVELPGLLASFDINPIAAMPSLHAAFPALSALLALQHFGRRGGLMGLYAVSVWTAIVYLGEHYVVDVLAGIALAVAVFALTRRARGDTTPLIGERIAPQRLALAFGLVAIALAVGQVTLVVRQSLPITSSFVRAELAGRTEKVSFFRGRIAYQGGDFIEAQQELRDALARLTHPDERREAQTLLALSAFRNGDFRSTIATLEGHASGQENPRHLLLLASAYVEAGEYEKGMRLLAVSRDRFPDDPEPLYWLTRYGFLHGQVAAQDVNAVADRLRTFPSPKSEPFRLALERLVDSQAVAAKDAQRARVVQAAVSDLP